MNLAIHDEPCRWTIEVIAQWVRRVVHAGVSPDRLDDLDTLQCAGPDLVNGPGEWRDEFLGAVIAHVDKKLRALEKPVLLGGLAKCGLYAETLELCLDLHELFAAVLVARTLEAYPLAGHFLGEDLGGTPVLGALGQLGEIRIAKETEALGEYALERGGPRVARAACRIGWVGLPV